MTISAARTVAVPPPLTAAYGTLPAPQALRWPVAGADANLDYYIDFTAAIIDAGDTIAAVGVSVAPSGAGELSVATVTIEGNIVGAWLSGGVAGRDYTIRNDVTTVAGRTFEALVGLLVDPATAAFPLPDPPSTSFGTPVT